MIVDLEDIIGTEQDELIYTYFSHKIENAKIKTSSIKDVPVENIGYTGYDFYCDYLPMIYHLKITPYIAEVVNKKLVPTFCWTRMYFSGSILQPHVDRDSCEITVSHCHHGDPWTISFVDKNFITQTGVSICYNGEDPHERMQPTEKNALYTFFSWVEKYGKYDEHQFDKSERLEKIYRQVA